MDTTLNGRMAAWQTKILWVGIALLGAISFAIVALNRGEAVNAAWLVVAAVCIYFIAYRFYGLWVARRALGDIVRAEMGPAAGTIAGIGILLICVIVLAVLALVVVKALVGSPWGTFAVFCTIPIALLMGVYNQFIRPGRVGEMSLLGCVLLLFALIYGKTVSETPALAAYFDFKGETLALIIIGYGFVASVLPVWLLLAPRDYLSTFLKVGTVALLAVGVLIARPELQMAAITKFVDGTGWVGSGCLLPFLFITAACGAVSGWHSLISSGTTPKMIESETQIAFIGYGGMLMESFVAIMAMIAASVIHPGVYFAMNTGAGLIGTTAAHAADVVSSWGFTVTPDMLNQVAHDVGELSVLSRTGGAPTLAVGMATIFSSFLGGRTLMAFWYHFVILFEALFILTTVDAGTRVCRFMIQDLVGHAIPAFKETRAWGNNLIGSAVSCVLWGYLLYAGVIDPYGGIWTMWPLFGATNQMLAAIALSLCTVVLFKMKRERYAWVTIVPTACLVVCTVTAGLEKVLSPDPKVGFLSHAAKFSHALAENQVLAPAKSLTEMGRVIFNDYVDATLAGLAVSIVVIVVAYAFVSIRRARATPQSTAIEIGGPAGAAVGHG